MKLTQEQINEIKKDPFYKLLVALTGDEAILDDAIKDLDREDCAKTSDLPLSKDDIAEIKRVVSSYRRFLTAGSLGVSSVPYEFLDLFVDTLSIIIGKEAANFLTSNALTIDNLDQIVNTIKIYYNE